MMCDADYVRLSEACFGQRTGCDRCALAAPAAHVIIIIAHPFSLLVPGCARCPTHMPVLQAVTGKPVPSSFAYLNQLHLHVPVAAARPCRVPHPHACHPSCTWQTCSLQFCLSNQLHLHVPVAAARPCRVPHPHACPPSCTWLTWRAVNAFAAAWLRALV